MSRQSCPDFGAGEAAVLCKAEKTWDRAVAEIRFGKEALYPALQNFLMSFGRTMERAEVPIEIDEILAKVGVARLPDKKGLTELEDQSLRILERRWDDLAGKIRGGERGLSFFQGFVGDVGRYLLSQIVKRPWAEKQQLMMQEFYRSLRVEGAHIARDICIPTPPRADEEIQKYFADGKNLIYEPSEGEVPVARLMASLPYRMLADDPAKIIWEPVREGRWLLVDAQEHCPRVGDRSFRGYNMVLEKGQRILTLPQYAILWHVGSAGGEILDLETDTLLATRYGADSILHAYGRALQDLQFSVGEWRHTTGKHPKMGARFAEVVA